MSHHGKSVQEIEQSVYYNVAILRLGTSTSGSHCTLLTSALYGHARKVSGRHGMSWRLRACACKLIDFRANAEVKTSAKPVLVLRLSYTGHISVYHPTTRSPNHVTTVKCFDWCCTNFSSATKPCPLSPDLTSVSAGRPGGVTRLTTVSGQVAGHLSRVDF